jgi:Family of unknown function (DUF6804)
MFTKIMKWVSVAVLLLAVFWRSSPNFKLFLESVVCVAGLMVFIQAIRTGKYFWAVGFVAIAVLFNPVVPVGITTPLVFWLDLACLGAFLISLVALKTRPILSAPSITGRRGIRESL